MHQGDGNLARLQRAKEELLDSFELVARRERIDDLLFDPRRKALDADSFGDAGMDARSRLRCRREAYGGDGLRQSFLGVHPSAHSRQERRMPRGLELESAAAAESGRPSRPDEAVNA